MLALAVAFLLAASPLKGFAPRVPRVIAAPELSYPQMARMARIQGTVTVKVQLTDEGLVASAEVVMTTINTRQSQAGILSNAALENVQKWKFEPLNPQAPSRRSFEVRYVFKLVGQPAGYSSRMRVRHPLTVEITSHPPVPGGDLSEVRDKE